MHCQALLLLSPDLAGSPSDYYQTFFAPFYRVDYVDEVLRGIEPIIVPGMETLERSAKEPITLPIALLGPNAGQKGKKRGRKSKKNADKRIPNAGEFSGRKRNRKNEHVGDKGGDPKAAEKVVARM